MLGSNIRTDGGRAVSHMPLSNVPKFTTVYTVRAASSSAGPRQPLVSTCADPPVGSTAEAEMTASTTVAAVNAVRYGSPERSRRRCHVACA